MSTSERMSAASVSAFPAALPMPLTVEMLRDHTVWTADLYGRCIASAKELIFPAHQAGKITRSQWKAYECYLNCLHDELQELIEKKLFLNHRVAALSYDLEAMFTLIRTLHYRSK